MTEETKTYYFTLSQGHTHRLGDITADCNLVIAIDGTYASARDRMFELCGKQWCMQYEIDELDLSLFPRGVYRP
jgi:hypothetical protein